MQGLIRRLDMMLDELRDMLPEDADTDAAGESA
jgi:hypothetical protein